MEKIMITKESLAHAYETMSVPNAMAVLGIKNTKTLYRLLDEANIPRKSPKNMPRSQRTEYGLVD